MKLFHGSNESNLTELNTTAFGSGAFQRLDEVSRNQYTAALYLTTSKGHAEVYGEYIYECEMSYQPEVVDFVEGLEQWAQESGYESAQQMIDDYYEGSVFHAVTADYEFEVLARRAIAEGKPAIIADFGSLIDSSTGSKFKTGQVVIVVNPEIISIVGQE
ncbi:hypothetical protein EHE65_07280 [Salmonella enterica subsp. enterica]|nr:hypothetical protein [Salmonella enterica subsp. enterica]